MLMVYAEMLFKIAKHPNLEMENLAEFELAFQSFVKKARNYVANIYVANIALTNIDHFDSEENQLSLELTFNKVNSLQNAIIITNASSRRFTHKNKDFLPVVKTIETVIKDLGDSIKDNLPIIAGVVGVGVVIYLVWSNWPPRKGPNKAPDKPDKSDDPDKPLRTRIRRDITLRYGTEIKEAFDAYKSQPGYEKLDPTVQRALDEKYAALYNEFYEGLVNKMFTSVKKWNSESIIPQQSDYTANLGALRCDITDITALVTSYSDIYNINLSRRIYGAKAPDYLAYFAHDLPEDIMNSIAKFW